MIDVIDTLVMNGTISKLSIDPKGSDDVKEMFTGSRAIAEKIRNKILNIMQSDGHIYDRFIYRNLLKTCLSS